MMMVLMMMMPMMMVPMMMVLMMMKYDPGIQRAWPAHALGRRRRPHLCLPCLLCREGGGELF